MSAACSTDGGKDVVGRKARGRETIRKTKAEVGA
jgi:hypothetical protein